MQFFQRYIAFYIQCLHNLIMFNFKSDVIDFAHKIDEVSHPNEEYEKHMHIFYELLFFVKGDVIYNVEGESHQLLKGDIVLIPSGKYHFASVNPNVTYERYVLKFSDKILPPHLKNKINDQSYFFTNTSAFYYHMRNLDNYFDSYDKDDIETLFITELVQLLIKVLRNPIKEKDKHNPFITDLVKYIDENIQNKITLDVLADHFHFSKSYISSEFKKQMKTPVIHYIKTKKIIAAHQYILQGMNKTKVAEMFGFDEYSTFYRAYLKIMNNNN